MESDALPRINRVIVTGFLQQQPELRHTPSGVPVASFRVRSGRVIRDRRGVARETISTFTVVTWQDLAVRVSQEAKLGQGMYVEGALHSRSFIAGNGERRTVVEVYADLVELVPVFLSPREQRTGGGREDEARPEDRGNRAGDRASHEPALPDDHQNEHGPSESGRYDHGQPEPGPHEELFEHPAGDPHEAEGTH